MRFSFVPGRPDLFVGAFVEHYSPSPALRKPGTHRIRAIVFAAVPGGILCNLGSFLQLHPRNLRASSAQPPIHIPHGDPT